METRALWAETLVPGVKIWFDDAYKRYTPMLERLFNVDTTDRHFEEFVDSTGVGKLVDVGEGGTVPYEDELEGYKTRLTQKTFKKGIKITEEQAAHDLYRNGVNGRITALAKAAARTADNQAFSVLRNAFSTSYTSYGDAKPLTIHSGFKTPSDFGKVQRWITLSKQAIAVQLQRLSEGATKVNLVDATVWSAAII